MAPRVILLSATLRGRVAFWVGEREREGEGDILIGNERP